MMPFQDGFEVFQSIREHSGICRKLAVIALNDMESAAVINGAKQLGARRFLIEPGSLDEMRAMMVPLEQDSIDTNAEAGLPFC